jgi:succinate dehydrogenase flavin-adding protein (antitoxin of CptAB toxin-antitoxin module)
MDEAKRQGVSEHGGKEERGSMRPDHACEWPWSAHKMLTPCSSLGPQLVNKLMYRSKQRGFLELDLMVGLWAEKELPKMPVSMLRHFSEVLDMENPDLFKWLTGQLPAPEEVASNPAYAVSPMPQGHVCASSHPILSTET